MKSETSPLRIKDRFRQSYPINKYVVEPPPFKQLKDEQAVLKSN